MKNIARTFLLAAAATVSLSAQSLITGPSSSQTPYLTPTSPGWSATSILTVGDAIGGYQMAGHPRRSRRLRQRRRHADPSRQP